MYKDSMASFFARASLIVLFGVTPFISQARAVDFYWQTENSHRGVQYQGGSPQSVCNQVAAIGWTFNYKYSGMSMISEVRFRCNAYRSSDGYTAYTNVRRFGDGCTSPSVYNAQTSSCENPQDDRCISQPELCPSLAEKGSPQFCPSPYAGNPINFAVGNKFQSETDYSPASNSTLNLIRSYNSLDGLWRHNFSTYLRFAGTAYASLVRHDGRESFFTISGTTITPTLSGLGVLTKTGTNGWQYVSANNEHFTFNTAGKLTHWSDTQGRSYQLAYSGSEITVTDNLGNSLTLTEDTDRQPLSLTAPSTHITYGYNAEKRLTSVTRTAGGQTTQRQFHYEVPGKPGLLTGITDELGVRYATWAYDDQSRAISSEHAGGTNRVSVTYSTDGTVSVTNELGKVAKYGFQYIKGVKRITVIKGEPSPNCPSSNSTFTYDDRGLLKTKTDNKGILTTYDYNERGLEISRTEASGTPHARTITTNWHPDWFLPVTITEPDRITQYTYDNQGRQTSQSVTQR
nr:DUF6531 domain-containing protein [Pseudomonas toyotomiensis]